MTQKPGVSGENYVENLPADVRKRYLEKTSVIQVDPYELSTSDFGDDFLQWPDLNYVDMVYFLVFQHSYYTREQLRNVKSLDAYEMQQDGWVRELFHKEINGNHLIKSKVRHSMRIREKPLDVWVIMRADGSVDSAHCKCMAGLDECCSHIAAVLFSLESATKARSQASVTDAPAYWMLPTGPRLDTPYKRVREMDFQSAMKKRKNSTSVSQPTEIDTEDSNFLDTIPSPTKHEEDCFYTELNKCLPTSAVLSLSDKFSENFVPKTQLKCWPLDLGSLYSSENESLTYDELLTKSEKTDIGVSKMEIDFLESETRKQSDSRFWYKYRVGRITASNFYAVCHTKIDNPSISLVKKLSNSDEYNRKLFTSAATEWGKRKEDTARKSYIAKVGPLHQNFQCSENGLILNDSYPRFGASPDGLISCDCCGKGCLEIKCPYTCKDKLTIEVGWLENSEGGYKLKKRHPYFYQIQMSLFITDRQFCDLFVWSPSATHMERITRDDELWAEMSERAANFHVKCLMPELLGKYFTRNQVLKPISAASDASNSNGVGSNSDIVKYCVCGGSDDGRKMIMCESENCSKQWFHMVCIKLKRVPKGKWLCKDCR